MKYLNLAADRVDRHLRIGFFDGLSGVAWAFEHLTNILVSEWEVKSEEDPLEDLDELILSRLERSHWKATPYDLISGLVGIGVFFLERLPRKSALRGIGLILQHLEQKAEETRVGLTWHTPPELLPDHQRRACPTGYYNLGVAHGVPGVIAFLGEVAAAGIEVARTRHLLDGSVQWLSENQQSPQALSRYSRWISPGDDDPGIGRLAWCYGDLGIGATLYHTALRVRKPEWVKLAKELLDRSLTRSPDKVRGPGLCHGAIGIAHLFNRAYHLGHDVKYKDAANCYYDRGLAIWKQTEPDHTGNDSSFLEGRIGVALALLSALDCIEPRWDRRLLLSGRDRSL